MDNLSGVSIQKSNLNKIPDFQIDSDYFYNINDDCIQIDLPDQSRPLQKIAAIQKFAAIKIDTQSSLGSMLDYEDPTTKQYNYENQISGLYNPQVPVNSQVTILQQDILQGHNKIVKANNSDYSSPEIDYNGFEAANTLSANTLPQTPSKKNPQSESDFMNTLDEILTKNYSITQSDEKIINRIPKLRLTTMVKIRETMKSAITQRMPVFKAGYLDKYSPNIFKGWQKRFFVLQDRKLKYYKSHHKEDLQIPQGIINFDHFKCNLEFLPNSKNFKIFIIGVDRIFEFRCQPSLSKYCLDDQGEFQINKQNLSAELDCNDWVDELKMHIESSDGFKFEKSANGMIKPWRFDNISESQFIQLADTGDILLFKTSNVGSAIQRTLTGSVFDHVAMILKFETDPNEIYYVDATGTNGVACMKWSLLRSHYGPGKFYERIIYRHVDFNRSDEMVEKLEIFLKEAVGRKYGLNPAKIMRRTTVKMRPGKFIKTNQVHSEDQLGFSSMSDERKFIDEQRTFFCSELVAKACKVLGILEDDSTACSRFMPSSFSTKGQSFLKLKDKIKITEELHIIKDDYSKRNHLYETA